MIKKLLLFATLICSGISQAQDFRIIYNVNGCAGNPFNGASNIYAYLGIGTINAGTTFDYFSGAYSGTANPLNYTGNGLWEICVDPYSFKDNLNNTPPLSATIFNITMYLHDAAGSIITGNCNGTYLQINNPMTAPTSLSPNIVTGIKNCFVGVEEIGNTGVALSCEPNPLNTSTEFTFYNSQRGKVLLEVFDILGKKVKSIVNGNVTAGKHIVKWNGDADNRSMLSNGCYFYTLTFEGKKIAANKIIIAR